MINWIVAHTDLRSVLTKVYNINLFKSVYGIAKIRAWRAARVSPAAENSFPMLSIVMPRRRRLPVPGPSTLYQGRSCGEMGTR